LRSISGYILRVLSIYVSEAFPGFVLEAFPDIVLKDLSGYVFGALPSIVYIDLSCCIFKDPVNISVWFLFRLSNGDFLDCVLKKVSGYFLRTYHAIY
jgi:hypothetical protein